MKYEDLLKRKNVVAAGKGSKTVNDVDTGREAVVVCVSKKEPLDKLKKEDIVPKEVDGIETDVVETGEIKALGLDRTDRHRPAPGGVSIGHQSGATGTFGMVVRRTDFDPRRYDFNNSNTIERHEALIAIDDYCDGEITDSQLFRVLRCYFDGYIGEPEYSTYILSNKHVIAPVGRSEIGDSIYQPGRMDGGRTSDIIGSLVDSVPIYFGEVSNCPVSKVVRGLFNFFAQLFGRKSRLYSIAFTTNKVDAAIAEPIVEEDISDKILEIGIPTGFGEVKVGNRIKKSGRTSGLNYGTVTIIDAECKVRFPNGEALFEDQIITTAIAKSGDSGSAVLNEDNKIVGLLFAGTSIVSIVNRIQNVIEALGLEGDY